MRASPALSTLAAVALGAWAGHPGCAAPLNETQGLLCRSAIAAAEAATHIPDAFLSAIGRIESGRPMAATGGLAPWPWTVNAAGTGYFYDSKAEAIQAVRQFQARGVQSLDVGCLQVNLFYHKDAFVSLEQAFDPAANASYAARLLLDLFQQKGSWPLAAAAYHSNTRALGESYQAKVLAEWAVPDRRLPYRAKDGPRSGPPAPLDTVRVVPAAMRQTSAAPPPATGFSRSFALPLSPGGAGRSLAAYRAMPVRLAMRPPP